MNTSSRREILCAGGIGAGILGLASSTQAQSGAKEEPRDLAATQVCRVKFLNSSSARITKTFAAFEYDDGSRSSDPAGGPGDVNIGPGEAGYRYSQNKCVKKVYVYLIWTGSSGGGQDLPPAPAGQCAIERGIELVPTRNSPAMKDGGPQRWTLAVVNNDGTLQMLTEKDLSESEKKLKEVLDKIK